MTPTEIADAFRYIDSRQDLLESRATEIENKVVALEQCNLQPCSDVTALRDEVDSWRHDLGQCSSSKDEKINSLSSEVHHMKTSLDKLDSDMGVLTLAVRDIGNSLQDIARNTADISEVVGVYKSAKGGIWILNMTGKAIIAIAAAITAWYIITHTSVVPPK